MAGFEDLRDKATMVELGESFKWDEVGKELVGRIVRVKKVRGLKGDDATIVELRKEDGEIEAFYTTAALDRYMTDNDLSQGDIWYIRYEGVKDRVKQFACANEKVPF